MLCKETHVATKRHKLAKICLVRVEEKGYHFNYKQHMDSIYTLPVCKKQYKIVVCMASNSPSTLKFAKWSIKMTQHYFTAAKTRQYPVALVQAITIL